MSAWTLSDNASFVIRTSLIPGNTPTLASAYARTPRPLFSNAKGLSHRSRWTRSFPDHVVTSNPCRSCAAVALMRDETLYSRRIGQSIAVCFTDLRHHCRQHKLGLRP